MQSNAKIDWRKALEDLNHPMAGIRPCISGAQYLAIRGKTQAAEAVYRELLAKEPEYVEALEGLAWVLELSGKKREAAEARKRAAAVEVKRLGVPCESVDQAVAFRMAARGDAEAPDQAPAAYMKALFDDYAETFDQHLVQALKYRGPQVLVERLLLHRPADAPLWDVLDAGCGTGLAGPLLRPLARRLDGVDLSPSMLDQARRLDLYDELWADELCAALEGRPDRYDCLASIDVMVYFGDLRRPLSAMSTALRPDGLAAVSFEQFDGEGFHLSASRRYRHAVDYITATAQASGLSVLDLYATSYREEDGRPAPSLAAVMKKTAV